MTLSAKLICLNPIHPVLNSLNQYLLNLARYDTDYDVRDRARFLRALTIPSQQEEKGSGLNQLQEHLKTILLSNKEPAVIESEVQAAASEYNIGSLSLLAHQPLPGYEPLPDFPQEQPDASVRDVEELEGWSGSRTVVMETGFGSDSFDSYRGGNNNASRFHSGVGASTALSGIEAMGSSSMYSPSNLKKKGNDYDLDAFYDESSDEDESETSEEETSSSESEEEESDEETDEEEETEGTSTEEEEEDDASSGLSNDEEDSKIKVIRKTR